MASERDIKARADGVDPRELYSFGELRVGLSPTPVLMPSDLDDLERTGSGHDADAFQALCVRVAWDTVVVVDDKIVGFERRS